MKVRENPGIRRQFSAGEVESSRRAIDWLSDRFQVGGPGFKQHLVTAQVELVCGVAERLARLEPEIHPRPTMMRARESWIDLSGPWQFRFDGDREERTIEVPHPYQHPASGIGDKKIHPQVWYEKSVAIPESWSGKDLMLHFNAVDFEAEVWVNDRRVGKHTNGHTHFSFDVTEHLVPGEENRLVVRVKDTQRKTQARGKQSVDGTVHGVFYDNVTGIWQRPWIEAVPKSRIDKVKIEPKLGSFDLRVEMSGNPPGARVEIEVLDGGKRVASKTVRAGKVANVRLPIAAPKHWSPEDPHLYQIHARIKDEHGEPLDEVESYGGLRTIEVKDERFLLNGKPFYHQYMLNQCVRESKGDLGDLIEEAKKTLLMGFNGWRIHQTVPPPELLRICDVLGLTVWIEMPSGHEWSNRAAKQWKSELFEVVDQTYNHPCALVRVFGNEGWGLRGVGHGNLQTIRYLEQVGDELEKRDPTREMVLNDGWDTLPRGEGAKRGKLITAHEYTVDDVETLIKRWEGADHIDTFPMETWCGPKTFAPGHRPTQEEFEQMTLLLTEIFGVLDQVNTEKKDELYGCYSSCSGDARVEKFEKLIHAIAQLGRVMGYCVTQLRDTGAETNGFLDAQGEFKVDPALVRAINIWAREVHALIDRERAEKRSVA